MNAQLSGLTGSNAEITRQHNRRVVLARIRQSGKMGRAEIARESLLSTQAVSNIIAALLNDGLLVEDGSLSHGRGLPAPQYRINAGGAHGYGIEIRPGPGSGSMTVVAVDLAGEIVAHTREPLTLNDPEGVCKQVETTLRKLSEDNRLNTSNALGAGVVMPGPFTPTGLSNTEWVLKGWQNVNPLELFQQKLDLPVIIENDANAAAIGERVSGTARYMNSYAYVYFGTGVGLGVVNHGRLFRGGNNNAGEIGQILIPAPGRNGDLSPTLTPLESVCSRQALQEKLLAVGIKANTVDDLDLLVQDQNSTVLNWIRDSATALSHAVHIVENLFDPDSILLGGALPPSMFKSIINSMELPDLSAAVRDDRDYPRVSMGALGNLSAAQGGAALVINQLFTPQVASSH